MLSKCSDREQSTVYKTNVFVDGIFDNQREARTVRRDDVVALRAYWDDLGISVSGMHVACLEADAIVIATFECPSASPLC